jgi:hypothetical protein
MASSYFDLPPQQKAPAATIEQVPKDQRKQLGRMSLMSPAVTQILEGLGDEHSDSDSDEEEEEPSSEEEDLSGAQHTKKDLYTYKARQEKEKKIPHQPPRPSSLSPSRSALKTSTTKGSGHTKASSAGATGDSSAKPKQTQPQMARFHSLRSMLFQANIQDKMKTVTREDCQKEQEKETETDAATKWKDQHDERQMHRPKTPEKDAQGKGGIGSRIRMTMRRMTTKDAGGMEKIREDGAPVEFNNQSSTASADNDDEQPHTSKNHPDSDNESINHSDVEGLVRWISRRDAANNGERRKGDKAEIKEDSGHESFGYSDVDDLVRYVSRRSDPKEKEENEVTKETHTGYSDASTESDSDLKEASSDEEEDADDLVRWISHHQGPKAGPVRRNLERPERGSDVEQHYDSDVPELGRWFKRHDGTSGESAATTPVKDNFDLEEEERGRPRSRECERIVKEKRHMTHDDVDELVRWVSSKDIRREATLLSANEDPEKHSKHKEEDKRQDIGMSTDDGSVSHLDVQDLVQHARKTSGDKTAEAAPPARVEVGDLRALRNGKAGTKPNDPQGELDEKKEELGMTLDEGSLSHGDVQDLVAHARKI